MKYSYSNIRSIKFKVGRQAITAGLILWLLSFAAVAQEQQTYCNPINIDYTYSIVHASRGWSFRSGADPAVVPFLGEYYMFVTRSQGYWHSKDLRRWEFVRPQNWYFESSNAPGAWPMGDSVLLALGNPASAQSVIYTDNPKVGTWRGAPSVLPLTLHDPALFMDDDKRVYLYHESSNTHPLQGVELDPKHYFLPKGKNKKLITLDPEKHGWERFGENHTNTTAGYLEGAWMTKYNGKYYLQYAAPGTQWNVYADGVYTSDAPLGPFTYQEYSPFSYKPGGFIRGAGHGSTVQDPWQGWWHFGTMVVGINFNFERRIGQFPADFDKDGQLYANTAYGDYPHYLPSAENKKRESLFTGWMLLSYKKPVKASSIHENYAPENVVDESIKSFWVAQTNKPEEWLQIDLEQASEVYAVQLNYHDYKSNIFGKPDTLYHQYLLEYSLNGKEWKTLVDKRQNKQDVPNYYVELPQPQKARYIRFTNYHVPTPNLAISGLRVFGKGAGRKPAAPAKFSVVRSVDRLQAKLAWQPVKGAQGYHLYYGIAPDKLYNSIMIYQETKYDLNALNANPAYYFCVEAFNENGISKKSPIIKAE
ncbi:family 43 glycosylhydrolase [uncultured Pontibacter sp.]|uniref:family 43 glycosylhydrolase n=1 Tax=uncultured Pontibacter sp. TaxID=453356 RepID=UPI00262280E1|nr:family 43 glycosylhydrolase [uncultured Pontibacter sp.]